MSDLVIVAIPEEDDTVWDVSSEKVPHVTLLFLGELGSVSGVGKIAEFLEHAANTSLERFYLDVDRRGVLGDDEADVLFFDGRWDLSQVTQFRNQLLQNDAIKTAYDSVTQYPEWTPHLTLGYPKTPAAELEPGQRIYSVRFDRVALWVDDYSGPEFQLKTYEYMDVAMSEIIDDPVKRILSHHGVKGMKWGRRKNSGVITDVTISTVKGKVKTSGGENQPASKDAVGAKIVKQKLKKSGTDSLSNKELQDLSTRLNLERQVSSLTAPPPAKKFIVDTLVSIGKQQITKVANDQAGKQVNKMMATKK